MAQPVSHPVAGDRLTKDHYSLETANDLNPLMEAIGDARFVLLGEASHGTHEFYTWRTAITKRLIREKGFSFVAVEGDWPDCYRINRFVKGYRQSGRKAVDVLRKFQRWPTWMWANWEVVALVEWLREHNQSQAEHNKAGFYGLDVYSLWESMDVMVGYLRKADPEAAKLAINALHCFEPYGEEMNQYAWSAHEMEGDCKKEVIRLLKTVRERSPSYDGDREAPLNASTNALVIANAENYYRSMFEFGDKTWNLRDSHMVSVLESIMNFHGDEARTIVWEHNTHVGDARATDMKTRGLWNVGQLVREDYPASDVFIVGFSSYQGTVIAGREWGAPMEKMQVPPATEGSVEHYLHQKAAENQLILLDEHRDPTFDNWKGHRAIGVVYRPEHERGNYVPTHLAKRYDALLHIDTSSALHPLHLQPSGHEMPDTYPFGI